MGVEGQVKTLPQVECDQLRLEISGPDMGPIIGRRGDTLDAIQYLGSLVLNNALDEHVRLSVDTENYREKRAESLERLARKMAMKVVKAHRSMTLEPMNRMSAASSCRAAGLQRCDHLFDRHRAGSPRCYCAG